MNAANIMQEGQKLENANQEHPTKSRRACRRDRNKKPVKPLTKIVSIDGDVDKELTSVAPDDATKNAPDVADEEETCSTATGEEMPEDSEDSALEDAVPAEPAKPDMPISSTLADDQTIFCLAKLMKAMSRPIDPSVKKSGFQSVKLPSVSLKSYASRVHDYFSCTDEVFVLTMVYIDRIIKRKPDFQLTDLTCHRLLLIGCMVAAKYHDDEYASNEYYARVGGIDTKELNQLEAEFLQLLGYRLFVGATEYEWFLDTLRRIP